MPEALRFPCADLGKVDDRYYAEAAIATVEA